MEAEKEERRKLRAVAVSDTHGEMQALKDLFRTQGDIFIHAGDFTEYGREKDFLAFMKQLDRLNFRHKVVIAGNHEINLDNGCIPAKKKEAYQKRYPCKITREDITQELRKRCVYLQHQMVNIEGVSIFGSPYTPYFVGNAFQYNPQNEKMIWNKLPSQVDLLVTHCPPAGILDLNAQKKSAGSQYLRDKVAAIQPKYHIFGHIHESAGMIKRWGTTFLNVAMRPTKFLI